MKKVLSVFLVLLIIISAFGNAVFAETTHRVVKDITIKACETGFYMSGKLTSGKAGEVTIEVCDAYTYLESFPIPSVLYRNQVQTDKNGNWSHNVSLANKPQGLCNVKIGTSDGETYNALCEYTGQNSGVVYTAIPEKFTLGKDDSYTSYLGDGIREGKVLIHFKAKLADTGVPEIRFLGLDAANANLWTGYDTTVDLVRYADGGWGTGTELDSWSVTNVKESETGREYSFDIWLDLDRQLILFYMDGAYWETIQLDETSPEFWGYTFRSLNKEGDITAEISDFRIIPYIYGAKRDFGKYCVPDYVYNTPDAYYTTENVGNIFYNPEDISFDLQIINKEDRACSYKHIAEICDEDGNVIYSEESEITLEAQEKKLLEKSFDLTKAEKLYGKMVLKTAFEDNATGEITSRTETEFLSVRKPEVLNKKLGINVHFGHYMGDPYTNMNLIKNAGLSSARDFVDYASYTGEVGFTRYNSWQPYAQEYGIDRLVILMGYDTETYGGVFPTTAAGRKNYTDYAVGVAEKLNGDAAIFELWNEMDWRTTSEQYALMLMDTVPAIKKVNSFAKIAVMCPARINKNERAWMQGVIDYIQAQGKNPADYMDIVSVHPYTRNIIPEADGCECGQESDSVGNLKDRAKAVRKMLDNEGLSNVKIISTEMGYYSTPDAVDSGRWNNGEHKDGITERQQADYSIRTVALLHNELDHMQFYVINKTQRYDLSEDGFGLTESYFGKEILCKGKPVYAAVAAFNDLLGNAEVLEENESNGCYDYVFKKADGKKMHLMWTTNESAESTYVSESGIVYLYDIYGNRTCMKSDNNEVRISLSGSPVYVEDADFAILDENNEEVNANSKTVKATAYVKTEDVSKFENVWLACSAFKDGKLISVTVKEITEAGRAETETINVEVADKVKAFLWEDLKPISDSCIKIMR